MAVKSIDDIKRKKASVSPGDSVAFIDGEGRVRIGKVTIKKVRCGKENCSKCPHDKYAYVAYRVGRKVKTKYLGRYGWGTIY